MDNNLANRLGFHARSSIFFVFQFDSTLLDQLSRLATIFDQSGIIELPTSSDRLSG